MEKIINPNSGTRIEKMPNWFSWRHSTREAHDAARNEYLSSHGKAYRVGVAQANSEERSTRSNADQVAVLDMRLGTGKGAIKERARLAA